MTEISPSLTLLFKGLDLGLDLTDPLPAAPGFLGARAGQALNHITVCARELTLALEPEQGIHDLVSKAALGVGKPLVKGETQFYTTRAGWLNANPALLGLFAGPDADTCLVMGLAREGWVNQNTAPKAITRLENALKEMGVNFSLKEVLPWTRLR